MTDEPTWSHNLRFGEGTNNNNNNNSNKILIIINTRYFTFSILTLLIGHQERLAAQKNLENARQSGSV